MDSIDLVTVMKALNIKRIINLNINMVAMEMHSSDLLSKDSLLWGVYPPFGDPLLLSQGRFALWGSQPMTELSKGTNCRGHCSPMQDFSNGQSLLWVTSSACLELLRPTVQPQARPTPLPSLVPLLHGVR